MTLPFAIPTTTAPYQAINIALNNQSCLISLYTKSINVPVRQPNQIIIDPNLQYENVNPVFIDLYVNDVLIIGGVIARNNKQIVRDVYLGFSGDLSVTDTQGNSDPYGVPGRLPPYYLRNPYQLNIPPPNAEYAPAAIANTMPGMGTRFLLVYWPPGTYTPGPG